MLVARLLILMGYRVVIKGLHCHTSLIDNKTMIQLLIIMLRRLLSPLCAQEVLSLFLHTSEYLNIVACQTATLFYLINACVICDEFLNPNLNLLMSAKNSDQILPSMTLILYIISPWIWNGWVLMPCDKKLEHLFSIRL